MKYFFKITLLIGLTAMLIGCKNDKTKQEDSKQPPDKTQQLEKNKAGVEENTIEGDTVLKTFGDFDISKDKLNLNIPIHTFKDSYNIEQIEDISTPNINAIIIRISNGKTRSMVGLPVTHTIKQTKSLKAQGLDIAELEKDGKLLVITLNSTKKIIEYEINQLRKCIDTIDAYDPKAEMCVDDLRKRKNKDDIVLPNDRQGSILLSL